ncbi:MULTISPECIES: MarR family winged helix-turn-helix transcriptional regulator [unclassified Isoptericola]|uniref:MarR family winged helix-turn-helix transcriptional regulator n=1 Tax=unclassified Isoptericola TaxID=2623355 RepID=UPI0036471FBA
MPSETPSSGSSTATRGRAAGHPATASAPFGAGPDLPTDRRVASLLVRLDVNRRTAEHRSELGTADGRLLWLLSDGRPRTLREIADALRLEQSTVNRQVNAALAAGYLRRFTEAGRPARLIEPTAEGLDAFERATSRALGAYADGLAVLGDEAGTFLDLLERFTAAYGEAVLEA